VNAADENKVAPAVDAMMNVRMIDFSCQRPNLTSIFELQFVPAHGIRLPIWDSGDLGTSPFFGQLSVLGQEATYHS
jgi:hypothetical protein